jgi:hypothetical protein
MSKAVEVATGVARRCLDFVPMAHVDNLLQRLRILELMDGDQVLLVMHHHLALVTLNLGQLAQEVLLTRKKIL